MLFVNSFGKAEERRLHCRKEFTLAMFGNKWKVDIIYHLGHEGLIISQLQTLLLTHPQGTRQEAQGAGRR